MSNTFNNKIDIAYQSFTSKSYLKTLISDNQSPENVLESIINNNNILIADISSKIHSLKKNISILKKSLNNINFKLKNKYQIRLDILSKNIELNQLHFDLNQIKINTLALIKLRDNIVNGSISIPLPINITINKSNINLLLSAISKFLSSNSPVSINLD